MSRVFQSKQIFTMNNKFFLSWYKWFNLNYKNIMIKKDSTPPDDNKDILIEDRIQLISWDRNKALNKSLTYINKILNHKKLNLNINIISKYKLRKEFIELFQENLDSNIIEFIQYNKNKIKIIETKSQKSKITTINLYSWRDFVIEPCDIFLYDCGSELRNKKNLNNFYKSNSEYEIFISNNPIKIESKIYNLDIKNNYLKRKEEIIEMIKTRPLDSIILRLSRYDLYIFDNIIKELLTKHSQ